MGPREDLELVSEIVGEVLDIHSEPLQDINAIFEISMEDILEVCSRYRDVNKVKDLVGLQSWIKDNYEGMLTSNEDILRYRADKFLNKKK